MNISKPMAEIMKREKRKQVAAYIPLSMLLKLTAAAAKNHRHMSQEIGYRLEKSLNMKEN